MLKSYPVLLIAVIVVGLALGACVGAVQQSGSSTTTASQSQNGTSVQPGQSNGAPSQMTDANGNSIVLGTIQTVSSKSLVIKSQSSTINVNISDSTKILKSSTITASQLKVGDSITATGQKSQDVTFTADSVNTGAADVMSLLKSAGTGSRGNGSSTGAAPSGTPQAGNSAGVPSGNAPGGTSGQAPTGNAPTGNSGAMPAGTPPAGGTMTVPGNNVPQGRETVTGTIEAINGQEITVKTDSGSTKITLGDKTVIQSVTTGSVSDLKANDSVTVTGKTGSDGAVTASVISQGTGQTSANGQATTVAKTPAAAQTPTAAKTPATPQTSTSKP